MFKITPIQTKDEQEHICFEMGAVFRPDAFAYKMIDQDSGALMGMSQFEIGEVGYIYDLREVSTKDDFEAMFILGRATMNFIDLCGVHSCIAEKNAAKDGLLKAIGFRDNGEKYYCDMTGMFDGKCGGHK